jgi:hypothetical protein
MECLTQSTRNISIVGVPHKNRTWELPNINQRVCCMNEFAVSLVSGKGVRYLMQLAS